jgi:UDP-glucuronate 4-epimerase
MSIRHGPLDFPLGDRRILVTGATGLIGFPLCRELACGNEVFGAARLRDSAELNAVKAIGATPVPFDLGDLDYSYLPDGIDVVFHLAAFTPVRSGRTVDNQRRSIDLNGLATGRLMARYKDVSSFVFASTGSLYAPQGRPFVEDDPYGIPPEYVDGYSLSKIIGEAIVQFLAVEWQIPSTILRIFQMYGPRGGAPTVRADLLRRGEPIPVYGTEENCNTIMFEDDYAEKLIRAAVVASVPAIVTNFAGQQSSIQQYCSIAAELLGVEARFVSSDAATQPISADLTRMESLLGSTGVNVREGMARVLEVAPEDRATGWGSFVLPTNDQDA